MSGAGSAGSRDQDDDRTSRVVVCDDRSELRDAIGLVLRGNDRFRIVGEAEDAASCLVQVDRLRPDVLILDVNMPGGGPSVTRTLRDRWPGLFILVYSGQSRAQVRDDMLAAGADRFVLKTGRLRPLIEALDEAMGGRVHGVA